MRFFILWTILTSFFVFSAESFPLGSGAKYQLDLKNGTNVELSLYIAPAKAPLIGVEMFFFDQTPLIPLKMWQAFQLDQNALGVVTIKSGQLLTGEMSIPEKMEGKHLKGSGQLNVEQFLFQTPEKLKKIMLGEEFITTPAGKLKTIHCQRKQGSQVVDFWIADEAMPLGLVKLESTGPGRDENFSLLLKSLLKNVKAKINPDEAIPLTSKGRSILEYQEEGWLRQK